MLKFAIMVVAIFCIVTTGLSAVLGAVTPAVAGVTTFAAVAIVYEVLRDN